MKKISREQLQVILMEEYINSYLDEDAVFNHHSIPGDLDDHNGCSSCAKKKATSHDHSEDCGCGSKSKHKKNSYMAKPQLAKIARYAQKLHDMIDDNEQLEDWQESKIAQMAQMIGDVYHSIEYDEHHDHDHHHDEEIDMTDLVGMIQSDIY